jgi:rhodanese-related sulfurtransferase
MMSRFLEFMHNHPWLFAAAGVVILILVVDEARRRLRGFNDVEPMHAVQLINRGAQVVDVRSPGDFATGHIAGARNIPLAEIDAHAEELAKRGTPVLLCCANGITSAQAARLLKRGNELEVHNLRGGINGWRGDNLPVTRG